VDGMVGVVQEELMFYINDSGELYNWGIRAGNAGSGTYLVPTALPVPPNGEAGWKGVVSDGYAILAWTDDASGNKLYGMGRNDNGTLATGNTTNSLNVWIACLDDTSTQISGVQKIMLGGGGNATTVYTLLTDGTLLTWGRNTYGSVGNGTVTSPVTLGYNVTFATGLYFQDVAPTTYGTITGQNGVTGLTTTYGELYIWGHVDVGLGMGNTTQYNIPTQIPDIYGVTLIRSSGEFSYYLLYRLTRPRFWSWKKYRRCFRKWNCCKYIVL